MNFRERLGAFFGGEEPKPEIEKTQEEKQEVEQSEKKDFLFSVIEKPNDEELVAKLERKLEEYKARTDDYNAAYKIAILETLLNEGSATYYKIEGDLINKENEYFDKLAFRQAFDVINAYVNDEGSVRGGTGLK